MAADMAALSVGSTWNASEMQLTATSIESLSSACRVPSVNDEDRKSQIASARRCLEVVYAARVSTTAQCVTEESGVIEEAGGWGNGHTIAGSKEQ